MPTTAVRKIRSTFSMPSSGRSSHADAERRRDGSHRDDVGQRIEGLRGVGGDAAARAAPCSAGSSPAMTCTLMLPRAPHQVVHDRPVHDLEPARARRLADDDVGDVVLLREADDVVGDAPRLGGQRHGLALQPLGQAHGLGDAVLLLIAELQAAAGLQRQGDPRRMQAIGQPLAVAHQRRASAGPRSRTRGCARPPPTAPEWRAPASARAAARRRARPCGAGPARAAP